MAITDIDERKLEAFVGLVATEVGAALNAALVTLGDELGLYRAMADGQPVSAAELAARTGTHERYVREWLNAQAASGFVVYDPASDGYVAPARARARARRRDEPVRDDRRVPGRRRRHRGRERVAERFVTGDGVGWHEHHHGLFHGTERAFAAAYRAHLVAEWLPALDGVVEKLEARRARRRRRLRPRRLDDPDGAGVPGLARSSASTTTPSSIATARERAAAGGRRRPRDASRSRAPTTTRARATTSSRSSTRSTTWATRSPPRATRATVLAPDGTVLLVEPYAGDRVEDNLNPVGRFYYGMSTLVCTPGSLSQPGRAGARHPGRRGAPARGAAGRRLRARSAAPPRRRSTSSSRRGCPRRGGLESGTVAPLSYDSRLGNVVGR